MRIIGRRITSTSQQSPNVLWDELVVSSRIEHGVDLLRAILNCEEIVAKVGALMRELSWDMCVDTNLRHLCLLKHTDV